MTEFLGDELRRVGIDHIGDFRHLALFHQKLDDIDATLRHAAGELLDCDCLWQDHFARELFLGLVDMSLEPLNAAAESGDGPGALFLFPGDIGDRQAAAAFPPGAPDRAWNSGLRRHSRTANNVGDFLVAGLGRFRPGKAGRGHRRGGRCLARGRCRRRRSRFAAGETPFGLGFRATLGFRILRAARLFLAFAGFGRGALVTFAGFSFFSGHSLDFGTLALLHLAFTGAGKGARPGLAFLIRQRTQNNPGRGPLRRRLRAWRGWLRARCRGGGGRRRQIRLARRDRAALHLLDDHRFRASMRKALAHDAGLDWTLQCERSGRSNAQRVAGVFGFIHQSCVPAISVSARRKAGYSIPHLIPVRTSRPGFPP